MWYEPHLLIGARRGPAAATRPHRFSSRLLTGLLLLTVSGCAAWPRSWGQRPCCVDTKPIVRKQPIWWHLFDVTVVSQIEQGFHLIRVGRKLLGVPVRSLNLRDGTIGGSAFFEDRDLESLSAEAVRWGPTRPEDAATPPFTVTKLKAEGKTAGFFVADARGVRYLFKLDPVDAPELLTGAEVVVSKLLYALGYHVPSYEIVWMRPEDLHVGSDATVKISRRRKRPLTEEDLEALLTGRLQDGTLRVVASKILEGEVLGPAKFRRFRDCAEMRALKVAYGWLNNTDAKDHNSLMVWNGSKTVGYLIDFGTSLGADAGRGGAKSPCAGWTHVVDLKVFTLELLTLGLYRSGCNPKELPINPRVGLFSERLEPLGWKPYAPNLAFEEMSGEDARWMTRRLTRLSRAQLEAAVSAGQYSDSADAEYLVETLEARRAAIVRRYLTEKEEQVE